MIKDKLLGVILISSFITITSCKKNNDSKPISSSSNGITLTADNSTIRIGGTTKITAAATGSNLVYSWSASAGDIIGSGSQITYGAGGCCSGENTITCTVKDGSGTQASNSIKITVN